MKKGFTLIELLAVILILGIIALIAVPQVTNVIGNASKGAAETSAKHYVDAVTNKIALSKLDTNPANKLKDGVYEASEISVDISGSAPESGTIVIDDGNVIYANVDVNGYTVTCQSNGKCHAAQYVYFQQDDEFTSLDQTTSEISTEHDVYLRINKDDINDIQACFVDAGNEFCFSPGEFEKTKQIVYSYFKFDPSDTSWEYEDQCDCEDGFEKGYYKTTNGREVSVEFYEDGLIDINKELVDGDIGLRIHPDGSVLTDHYHNDIWFTCYLDFDEPDDYVGCDFGD